MKDYRKAKQITLKKNYRSNQTILDNAYQLIKNNDPDTLEVKLGISKKLVADNNSNKSDKNAVAFNFSESAEDEADFVAKEITKLNKKFNIITCAFDTINHLSTLREWEQLFKMVNAHLGDGGIFIFDFNTIIFYFYM